MACAADLRISGQSVFSLSHVMKIERSVLGAMAVPVSFLKRRLTYMVHADDSNARSGFPSVGWKR